MAVPVSETEALKLMLAHRHKHALSCVELALQFARGH